MNKNPYAFDTAFVGYTYYNRKNGIFIIMHLISLEVINVLSNSAGYKITSSFFLITANTVLNVTILKVYLDSFSQE